MRRAALLVCISSALLLCASASGPSSRKRQGCASPVEPADDVASQAHSGTLHSFWHRLLLQEQQDQPPKLGFNWRCLSFYGLAVFGFLLASGAGVGGGDVLVPLLILVAGFPISTAVALSNIGVFGGGVGNFILNVRRRHPHEDKPLIDWELVTIMEPTTVAGAVFAGYLNKILPVWLISDLLLLLLAYLTWSMGKKGSAQWEEESSEQKGELEEKTDPRNLTQNADWDDESEEPPSEDHEYEEKLELPRRNLALLAGLFAMVIASDLGKTHVQCASLAFWLMVGSVVPVAIAIAITIGQKLVREYKQARREGAKFQEGDIKWTPRNVTQWPLLCIFAGGVAGLFGVGGGIVKGPMMLKMGVLPQVASASCSTMILFTSLASSITYAFFGEIPWGFAGVLFLVGLGVTLVGQKCTQLLVGKLGRQSIIVLAMTALNGAAACLMLIQGFRSTKEALQSHNMFMLKPLC